MENTSLLVNRIGTWISTITTPEFRQYKQKQIGYVLADDVEHDFNIAEPIGDFTFPKHVEVQHKLIMSFLHLHQSGQALSQCEYYFRRYPFRNLPVSKDDHARNMCEFYLNNVYITHERLKKLLRIIAKTYPDHNLDIRATMKNFNTVFKQEISMRNDVVHVEPFEELSINRLFLTRILSENPSLMGKGWDKEHLRQYRLFTATWSRRARENTRIIDALVDSVAQVILEKASFLRE